MTLHIYIAGREAFCAAVAPGNLDHVLRCVQSQLLALAERGRVTVTLDSDRHTNVTYLLNKRFT